MEKVYIAGPITGIENYEIDFEKVEKKLRRLNYNVINPVKLCRNLDKYETSHERYMKKCIPALCECDFILMLPGWENSEGATLEKLVAEKCGLSELKICMLGSKW